MQTFEIGETLIDIPDFLETRDDDGTLVAFPPETDFANLRFSVISVRKNDGTPSSGAGERHIRKKAREADAELTETNGKLWYHSIKPSSEGSDGSLMHYWFVGMDAFSMVVSCFVDFEERENPMTQRVLDAVMPAIESFRKLK